MWGARGNADGAVRVCSALVPRAMLRRRSLLSRPPLAAVRSVGTATGRAVGRRQPHARLRLAPPAVQPLRPPSAQWRSVSSRTNLPALKTGGTHGAGLGATALGRGAPNARGTLVLRAALCSRPSGGAAAPSASDSNNTSKAITPAPKRYTALWAWHAVRDTAKHYWHGSKLLAADTRIAWKLLGKMIFGRTLSRR